MSALGPPSTKKKTKKKEGGDPLTSQNAYVVSLVEHIKSFTTGKVPDKILALKGIEMIAYCGGVSFEQVSSCMNEYFDK